MDGLTGICNRLHFIALAEKVLDTSRRTGEQVCILLCDLDHFKSINDRYGHATGDFVLKRNRVRLQCAPREARGLRTVRG